MSGKVQGIGGAIAATHCYLGTRIGWVISNTLRPLYPRGRPGTHCTGRSVGARAWLEAHGKSHCHGDSIPGPSSPKLVATPTTLSRKFAYIKRKYRCRKTGFQRKQSTSMLFLFLFDLIADVDQLSPPLPPFRFVKSERAGEVKSFVSHIGSVMILSIRFHQVRCGIYFGWVGTCMLGHCDSCTNSSHLLHGFFRP